MRARATVLLAMLVASGLIGAVIAPATSNAGVHDALEDLAAAAMAAAAAIATGWAG
jgi:hypothetical protein